MLSAVAECSTARPFPPWFHSALVPATDLELEQGWPLLATPVSAGFPSPANDSVERHLSLDEHLIRNPESTFLIRVSGDALRESGVHDGDLLVIDRATPPTTGSLVVAMVNGGLMLRRLADAATNRRLVPVDSLPLDEASATEESLAPLGVARWVIHRLWPGREPGP